jgi:hypothetical protein
MDTTRLRRTFHYPSDSDDPPDLDEEHQETLLQDLETTDKKTSTLYRQLFLALPALTTLYSILNPNYGHARLGRPDAPATATALFLTLVQIAVPVLAAWVLYFHPVTVPGRQGLGSLGGLVGKGTHQSDGNVKVNARRLIVLGLSFCGILVIAAWAKRSSMSVGLPGNPEGQARMRRVNGEYHEVASLLFPAGRFCTI